MTHTPLRSAVALLGIATGSALLPSQSSAQKPARPSVRQNALPDSVHHPYQPAVDVRHYDFTVRLPRAGSSITATSVLTLTRTLSLDTLTIDLIGMTVDEVRVGGAARAFTRDSARIGVLLRRSDGTALQVAVRYHGEPADGLIVRTDSLRGWSAFGDNWPNRARHWLATVDHPSDKATVTWTVTAPESLAVIANGNRVSHVRNGATHEATWRFTLTQPIPTYLMVIGAAQMHETPLGATACGAAEQGGCVPQSVWTFTPEQSFAPGPFDEAGRVVATFAKLFGPFPYPRLAHLQSATRFGGMENATAIFYSDNAFRNRTLGIGLIAHETAHQWFGDAVTPRRWQDVWLSEGFASYLTPLYARAAHGDSAFRGDMARIREQVIAAPVVAQRPVVDTLGANEPMTLLNANSYQKGAFVLHMIRGEIGDSAFFRALREYQRTYRHGTAITDELRALFEKQHGRSLSAFFGQWLHRPGWAELEVAWKAEGDSALTLEVTQSERFAPFAVPLVVRVSGAEASPQDITVRIPAERRAQLRIALPQRMTVLRLDADPLVELLARVTVRAGG